MSLIGLNAGVTYPAWMAHGTCSQTDPDAFFRGKGEDPKPGKRVCRHCPVTTECLQYALDTDQRWGTLGGYTENERRRIKRGLPPTSKRAAA